LEVEQREDLGVVGEVLGIGHPRVWSRRNPNRKANSRPRRAFFLSPWVFHAIDWAPRFD
jgi:hypothetical protein